MGKLAPVVFVDDEKCVNVMPASRSRSRDQEDRRISLNLPLPQKTPVDEDAGESDLEAAHTLRRTGQAVPGIINEIIEVASSFTQLTDSLSEMSAGSRQIVDAISHLNDLSSEVRESHGEISTSVESMQAVMKSISRISHESISTLKV